MTSDKQAAANQRNAEHSTGPKTDAGKKTVGQNALKHGLSAQTIVLSDEDGQAFVDLRENLHAEYAPAGERERQLVDRMAEGMWRLRRVARIESDILSHYRRQATDEHASRLLEKPETDPQSLAVLDYLNALQVSTAQQMTDAQKRRTAEQQPANPPTPEAEDPLRPAAQTAAAEAAEKMAELLTAGKQALTPDLLEAAAQTQAHLEMQRAATARDLEAVLVGASLGEGFLLDAAGSDALGKLSRHERDLWNNMRKIHLMLTELQDGRVEPVPDSS